MRWRLHFKAARLIVGNALQLLGAKVAGERSPADDDLSATHERGTRGFPRSIPPILDPEQIALVETGAGVVVSAKGREMLERGNHPPRRPVEPGAPVVVTKRQVQR